MDKDRNQRSETILNLTLEIIYLLTGKDCVIVSKTSAENVKSSSLQLSGGWTRTHSSNMEPQSLIPERSNDLKILELTNKIIQLLTGEDRDYVGGLKDLVMCNQQPFASSGLTVAKENSGELHSFVSSPDCTNEDSAVENNIKGTKWEAFCIDRDQPQIQCPYTSIKEESCDKDNFIDPIIQTPTDHAQTEYILCHTKEECASPKEEILTDTDITTFTDYTQPQSTDIKVTSEELSLRDTNNYTSSGHKDIKYTNIHMKELCDTHKVENVTDNACSTSSVETQQSPSQIDQNHQTREKPFLCPECGKRFKCKPGFIRHQKLHTGERMYSCSVCEKTYITKSDLSMHQKLHTGEKPYSCVECGKCFLSKWHLVNHHKVHTGEKPYFCSECGKSVSTKSSLVQHQKLHMVKHHKVHTGDKPYMCNECGKSFIVRGSLAKHTKIHTGEKPYPCSECGKCFMTRSNLATHHKIHTGEKPFFCVECGKSFINNAKLVLHQKIHTKPKPFSCPECGKCFTAQSFLVTHQKSHSGDKIYSCTECEKCYTNSYALTRHLRSHTGVRPYCCEECGKRFTLNSHLFRHQKIHSR